jgi:hypothetical protein
MCLSFYSEPFKRTFYGFLCSTIHQSTDITKLMTELESETTICGTPSDHLESHLASHFIFMVRTRIK